MYRLILSPIITAKAEMQANQMHAYKFTPV